MRGSFREHRRRVRSVIRLDLLRLFTARRQRRSVPIACLALALDRPVVIHTREADDDTVAALREEGGGRLRGVFHCFTGNHQLAQAALELGFYISVAGILTFPKAEELRQVIRRVPLDRLLVETDSPFLAPVPHRGKRNEPAHVARVVATLAEVHGTDAAAVARQTTANFHSLFRP
jgi:TatD DNase family protein